MGYTGLSMVIIVLKAATNRRQELKMLVIHLNSLWARMSTIALLQKMICMMRPCQMMVPLVVAASAGVEVQLLRVKSW